jgi:PAS domain S-box-containing protein
MCLSTHCNSLSWSTWNYWVYLYYALGLASYVFVPTVLLGLGYQYLWPKAVWWNDKSLVVVSGLALAFFSQFIKGFLNLARREPKLAWLFNAYTAICVLCAFGALVWPYTIMIQIVAFFVAVVPLSGYISGIRLWLRTLKSARLFVLSWSLFVIAAVCFVLNKYGIFPLNIFTEYTLYIGSTTVVILLSLALADRINEERQEKVAAQHAAIRHLEKYRALYERSLEGLFRTDLDGHLLSGNSALASLFGAASLNQLVKTVPHIAQCLIGHNDAWVRVKTELSERGELRGYEIQGQRLNGDPFWGVLFARIVDEPNGKVIEGSLIDITDRK